jgi:hypothetical protein
MLYSIMSVKICLLKINLSFSLNILTLFGLFSTIYFKFWLLDYYDFLFINK